MRAKGVKLNKVFNPKPILTAIKEACGWAASCHKHSTLLD
jgi:hypothetical protein